MRKNAVKDVAILNMERQLGRSKDECLRIINDVKDNLCGFVDMSTDDYIDLNASILEMLSDDFEENIPVFAHYIQKADCNDTIKLKALSGLCDIQEVRSTLNALRAIQAMRS